MDLIKDTDNIQMSWLGRYVSRDTGLPCHLSTPLSVYLYMVNNPEVP